MLAPLNLPFSAVELFDDPLKTSASLLPPGNADIESGFAGMLRLRVDASEAAGSHGGQGLPPGGSPLPTLPNATTEGVSAAAGRTSVDTALRLALQPPQRAHAPTEHGAIPPATAGQVPSGQAAAADRFVHEAGVFAARLVDPTGGSSEQVSAPAALLQIHPGLAGTPLALPVIPEAAVTVPDEQPAAATELPSASLPVPAALAEHPATGAALPDLLQRLDGQAAAESSPLPLATTAPEGMTDSTSPSKTPDVSLIAAVNYPATGEAGVESTTLLPAARGAGTEVRGDAMANVATASQPVVDSRPADKSVLPPAHPNPITVAARADEQLHADAGRQAPPLASATLKEPGQARRPDSSVLPGQQATTVVEARPPLEPSRQPEILPLLKVGAHGEAFGDIVRPGNAAPPHTQSGTTPLAPLPAAALSAGGVAAGDSGHAAILRQTSDLISSHVRDPAWGERVSERVLMMASNQLKTAEIRLTPAELGPLRVQVALDDGAAHVTFHAQHALTRDAIEQALPRLREMLAENGIALGQADVGERGVAEGNRDGEGGSERSDGEADAAYDGDPGSEQALRHRPTTGLGLVDTFA